MWPRKLLQAQTPEPRPVYTQKRTRSQGQQALSVVDWVMVVQQRRGRQCLSCGPAPTALTPLHRPLRPTLMPSQYQIPRVAEARLSAPRSTIVTSV
jgi:hypothetical protein